MQLANPAAVGATLKDLLQTDSARHFEDAAYLKARLSDRIPQSTREIPLIVVAQKAGVPQSLHCSPRTYSLRSSLVAKLQSECGLSQEAASWAIDCWASALDITFVPDALAVQPRKPPVSPPPRAAQSGPRSGPEANWNGAPIDPGSRGATPSLASLMTAGALQEGVQRIQEENRPDPTSNRETIRKLAIVAVLVDTGFRLILGLSMMPAPSVIAGMFSMAAIVITFALFLNKPVIGKTMGRVLLFGAVIVLMSDIDAVATKPGFLDVIGMLLNGLALYMCFRVGFERTVPTQTQQINVEMRPQ